MNKKNLKKIDKMSEILKKFAEGLSLPPEMVESLSIVRDNNELKIFALSLPTLKYPDSYLLAGRIFMYVNIKNCPINIEEYISIAKGILRQEIKDFMLKYSKEINQLLYETYYQNFEKYNILSASSCVNYLLKISHEENPIETPCQMFLRQAIQFYYQDSWEEVKQCYYELINQDYVHASPTMFNAGTRKNQMSSCFKAGTQIFTYNRGIVNIEDVKIGDEVKTHKGNIKKVSQLHKNLLGDRKLYNVKLSSTLSFGVTDNHRFWAIQAEKNKEPTWIPIEELSRGDLIALPPVIENSQTFNINLLEGDKIVKEWVADKNWAFFLGMWFGKGDFIKENDTITGIKIKIDGSNYPHIEKLIKICKEKTGVNVSVQSKEENDDICYLYFYSTLLAKHFVSNYGSEMDSVKLDKRMYYWGTSELKSFISGFSYSSILFTINTKKAIIEMNNFKLLREIFYLSRANGFCTRYTYIRIGMALLELPYDYLDLEEKTIEKITIDNQTFVRLDTKNLSLERPEHVYTIGVEDDHSYCIEGVMAENCFLLSLGDNLESLLYSGAGDVGLISKLQGGIGLSMNAIRHSNISNTGKSSGVLPFGKIYDATIACVNQGGKRNGAMTITLIDWHIDFMDFIQARDNYTHNGIRFKQANTCAYLSRLFMDRVKKDQDWTFFCPAKAKINGQSLLGSHGHKFEEIYEMIEKEAIVKKEEFNKLEQEIKDMEKLVNQANADRELILEYHNLTIKRIKMRKHLIDYKVMKARDVYNKLCDMNVKSSMPYIVYRDPVNEKNNMANIGTTESLNLCVAPETLVLTNKGHVRIGDLENQNVQVWNGKEFSEVIVKQTGENQKLIKINFSDGSYLECTPYHKFYIQKTHNDNASVSDILKTNSVEKIEAQDLKPNMKLVNCFYPLINEGDNMKNAYNFGLNYSNSLYVPFNKSLKSKIDWLSGYFDAEGCIVNDNINQSLHTFSDNKKFLLDIKYMLQTCGCNAEISLVTEERKTLLSSEKDLYRLLIHSYDLQILVNNGLETQNMIIEKRTVQKNNKYYITVKEIEDNDRKDNTYCFTEHKRNAGVFNGVFTSQCLEISEPSTPDSIASCNLGHLNLKAYIKKSEQKVTLDNLKDFYDFDGLGKATQSLTRNINKVIDYNYYPLDERDEKGKVIKKGKISTPNFANRPIGIGVSGLAEVFAFLDIAYDSPEAFKLNKMIFAAMYYHSLYQSRLLALKEGEYSNFRTGESEVFNNGKWEKIEGSPLSNGFFQFDLWQQEANYLKSMDRLNTKIYNEEDNIPIEPKEWGMDEENHSWAKLRENIVKDGVRNAMLIALMPTASSAQLLNNAETTEAHQTLVYSRKLVHGNFTAFSEPFVDAMRKAKLWNKEAIDFIMMSNGSIEKLDHFVADNQSIFPAEFYNNSKIRASKLTEIQHLKRIHRGMYEISQKDTMQMARQRGIYVCQSQSLNIYLPEPDIKKMKAVHGYSNALGLKTGMYYLRANPASQTERFTVDISIQEYHKNLKNKKNNVICTDEVCIMCQ